jgi:hypothetical protein
MQEVLFRVGGVRGQPRVNVAAVVGIELLLDDLRIVITTGLLHDHGWYGFSAGAALAAIVVGVH